MASPVKSSTALLGTYSSEATIAHGGTPVYSTAPNMSTYFGVSVKWWVTYPGSPGTVAVVIQPQVSDDGSNWTDDGGPFIAPIEAGETVSGTYQPPEDELYARLVLMNADSSVDATAAVVSSYTSSVA